MRRIVARTFGAALALGGIVSSSTALAESSLASTATTASSKMPEDGGPLPRAPMPEGGVDDGMTRAKPPQRESDDVVLPRAPMPEGGADEQVEGDPQGPRVGSAPVEPQGPVPLITASERFPDYTLEVSPAAGVEVRWNGFVRLLAELVQNDRGSDLIGRSDGFKLANARLGIQASKGLLSGFISLEAAAGARESFGDPSAELSVRPRDLWVRYDLSRFAQVMAGRFKVPYDLGEIENTAERYFIDQPLDSRGVLPTLGNELLGLSHDRQLGVMIYRERLGLSREGADLGYALALTNGRTFGLAQNDNDRPAAFARLSAFWGQALQLNIAGFFDPRRAGEQPNRFEEQVLGGEVSGVVALGGLRLQGQLLAQRMVSKLPERIASGRQLALGGHAQAVYLLGPLLMGYRFAVLDPNDRLDADRVLEHTFSAGYSCAEYPLRFVLTGTLAHEQTEVANDRVTLLTQFTF